MVDDIERVQTIKTWRVCWSQVSNSAFAFKRHRPNLLSIYGKVQDEGKIEAKGTTYLSLSTVSLAKFK